MNRSSAGLLGCHLGRVGGSDDMSSLTRHSTPTWGRAGARPQVGVECRVRDDISSLPPTLPRWHPRSPALLLFIRARARCAVNDYRGFAETQIMTSDILVPIAI